MCRSSRETAWKSFRQSPVGDTRKYVRMVAYNMGRGGSRNPQMWSRLMRSLEPDLLFFQESPDPAQTWLGLLDENAGVDSWLWTPVPGGKWGTGIWARGGQFKALPVPGDFTGRVVGAVVEGRAWPGIGVESVLALSIHAPTRKGSSYIKEVGRILDIANGLAGGLPMILAGDFNVVVGMRKPEHTPSVSKGERELLERLRDEFDLIPCWQATHPGEPLARTLRWMWRKDSLPYHCDGLFVPAEWGVALQECTILEDDEWSALSDHNPVVATFDIDTE